MHVWRQSFSVPRIRVVIGWPVRPVPSRPCFSGSEMPCAAGLDQIAPVAHVVEFPDSAISHPIYARIVSYRRWYIPVLTDSEHRFQNSIGAGCLCRPLSCPRGGLLGQLLGDLRNLIPVDFFAIKGAIFGHQSLEDLAGYSLLVHALALDF